MRVAAVIIDLMLFSRIEAAAAHAGAVLFRADTPADLLPLSTVDLLLVDWSARRPDWANALIPWRDAAATRLILVGRHTDLGAHAAAKAAGLGPMWARSRLVGELRSLLVAERA